MSGRKDDPLFKHIPLMLQMWLGIIVVIAAFWLAIVRAFGVFGDPWRVDGSLILLGILAVVGLVFVAHAVDAVRDGDGDE